MSRLRIAFVLVILAACSAPEAPRIDRFSLVSRHNVRLNAVDTLGSLTVGNGEFALTVDVSGLQTFPDEYENGIPLGTQSQWAWHSFPNRGNYTLDDVAERFESCDQTSAPYAVQQKDGRGGSATDYLRANPHRLHLGTIGLLITKQDGTTATLTDLTDIDQELNLWNGMIESTYKVEGQPVKVTLYALQDDDGITARIESPLLAAGRLKARIRFPFAKDCHVCPGYQWNNDQLHQSRLDSSSQNFALIERRIDSTRYFANVNWSNGGMRQTASHEFQVTADAASTVLDLGVVFSRDRRPYEIVHEEVKQFNLEHWKNFWMGGAAIDLSECTDERAPELERRIVLSQYLTKVQCSGSMPPQETGLTMNSWYGKFHLEMHWWHATHFALWNRASLLNRSLQWYESALEPAEATAAWQGYRGARWQKMTDPYGNESPSDIGAFIIWQQPHPIYLAELMYRSTPDPAILKKYSPIVFATADFMSSFVRKKGNEYHLCRPLIPAQEIFKATETDDPAYELQYWKWALNVAQTWRRRMSMEDDATWQDIIDHLAPLAVADGMYLPTATSPAAYTDDQYRRDHPSVLAALGCLPADERIDPVVMRKTLDDIMGNWQWETTWGWDYPMIAMTAARLDQPEKAIDALMMKVQKNTYLVNGHNYQDKRLRLYLPGNGGLLTAVAMMAGGWDGSKGDHPGFPRNGKWNIRSEGFAKMP